MKQTPFSWFQSAILLTLGTFSLCVTGRSTFAAAPERIDFGRDVRPILSDKCYFCHGPDEKARKAKLRFDVNDGPEGAFRVRDGKSAIVPGKSGASEIVRRILEHDPDEQMPPP